jgi:hypothetical protein
MRQVQRGQTLNRNVSVSDLYTLYSLICLPILLQEKWWAERGNT